MIQYSKEKIDKLGNTIIFLAENIEDLSKTKLLKLLFLLEECYVKKYGIPFLDIDFEVWQAGPVNRETYIELSDELFMLKDYIIKECSEDSTYIKPGKAFSDNEFSDNELNMLEFVVKTFSSKSATELVDLTHKTSSPWYIIAEKTGLLKAFHEGLTNSSEVKIDFSEFYCSGESEIDFFNEQKMFNRFVHNFSV